MRIEVAVPPEATTKQRGDLLEGLAKKLLQAQSYDVIDEIRFTAVELDLLCRHKISGREIYVECKAYRNNIDANILKNLAGTLLFKGYDEGWLISTAEFGKEAKGFVSEWQEKPKKQAAQLSFYTPELVINSLISSGTIQAPPDQAAATLVGGKNLLGEWTLSITPYGTFWLCTKLSGGVPVEVIAYYASDNQPVEEIALLKNLSETDTTLAELNFVPASKSVGNTPEPVHLIDVVTVQYGESWSDYRPSRPQDFVGRDKDQHAILTFFRSIINKTTPTRIFAFTGDSGMGKSSLVAKITDRSNNYYGGKKFFVYPVDIRAATTPTYVYSALLKCLRSAQVKGFGKSTVEINITDISSPLNSESIREYLLSVEKKGQLVVLVLDQFEELYTKPELYEIFDRARSLLLSCAAFAGNFCLGFAWKTDSTIHAEHPGYFFWHNLSDYRLTRKLGPFSDQDSAAVLNIFERQLGQKLQNDLRHNLLVSSQGYPWLLKKLCIHLYDKIESGIDQRDLLENELDVRSLFDDDLNQLTGAERACLEFIANRAPVDWFEVVEISTADTINSLVNRRLVVKSGDRLNVYWDIFREYLLTGRVPVIPFRYLPSTEFSSIWRVVQSLDHSTWRTVQEIANITGFSEGTVQNIGTDINMFGIASRDEGSYLLAPEINTQDPLTFARRAREKFKRHAFCFALQARPSNTLITVNEAVEILKGIFQNSSYAPNTWHVYTVKLCRWLELCGFLTSVPNGWVYRDKGGVSEIGKPSRTRRVEVTAPYTSPSATVACLEWVVKNGGVHNGSEMPHGYTGAIRTLQRYGLIEMESGTLRPSKDVLLKYTSVSQAIIEATRGDAALVEAIKLLAQNPSMTGQEVGAYFNKAYDLAWSDATQLRFGRPMKQWALWIAKMDGLIH